MHFHFTEFYALKLPRVIDNMGGRHEQVRAIEQEAACKTVLSGVCVSDEQATDASGVPSNNVHGVTAIQPGSRNVRCYDFSKQVLFGRGQRALDEHIEVIGAA